MHNKLCTALHRQKVTGDAPTIFLSPGLDDTVAIERSQIITAVSFVSQARCHSIPDEVNVASLVNKNKNAFCVFQSALMAT